MQISEQAIISLPKERKRDEVESFKWQDFIKHYVANKKVRIDGNEKYPDLGENANA